MVTIFYLLVVMNVKKLKTADKVLISIILFPTFLFSLNMFIKLNQMPDFMNVSVYTATLLLIIIGMVLINITKTQKSNFSLILGSILVFLGIFGTSCLALFVLKDISSLVFVGIILIPIILIYLILKK